MEKLSLDQKQQLREFATIPDKSKEDTANLRYQISFVLSRQSQALQFQPPACLVDQILQKKWVVAMLERTALLGSTLSWSSPGSQQRYLQKRDLKRAATSPYSLESTTGNWNAWRAGVSHCAQTAEDIRNIQSKARRASQRARAGTHLRTFFCDQCGKDYHFRVGLFSHSRKCKKTN